VLTLSSVQGLVAILNYKTNKKNFETNVLKKIKKVEKRPRPDYDISPTCPHNRKSSLNRSRMMNTSRIHCMALSPGW